MYRETHLQLAQTTSHCGHAGQPILTELLMRQMVELVRQVKLMMITQRQVRQLPWPLEELWQSLAITLMVGD